MQISDIPSSDMVGSSDIMGGVVLGILLTTLCFGVLTIQTSTYYHAFPKDGRLVKLAVAVLWAFQAFQVASGTRALYWTLVTNDFNPFAMDRPPWNFAVYMIPLACPSLIVQTFFAYRLYSLSGNLYAGVLVQVLVLLQFGFAVATTKQANRILGVQVLVKDGVWLVLPWFALQAVADIVIATSMCLLLRRRRTGFQKTDSVINRMILYTISTGLVTSVLSCIYLILLVKSPFSFGALVMGLPMGAVYSITMLANLHMRTRLRARLDTPTPFELIVKSIKKITQPNAGDHGTEERPQATTINITREAARNDVDIELMYRDTEVRSTVGQSPVLGGT